MVLTAIALVAGAIWSRRRGGSTKQTVLMLVLAAVIAANVAIWTMPDASGDSPLERLPD
ncbi:MAG: hypothetical protein R3E09_16355 [Novosphingobium sp.]